MSSLTELIETAPLYRNVGIKKGTKQKFVLFCVAQTEETATKWFQKKTGRTPDKLVLVPHEPPFRYPALDNSLIDIPPDMQALVYGNRPKERYIANYLAHRGIRDFKCGKQNEYPQICVDPNFYIQNKKIKSFVRSNGR